MNVHFLVPGDLEILTSCHIYDRRIIEGLKRKGHNVKLHRLADDFPFPSQESLNHCSQIAASIPKSEPVIIESLAFGAVLHIIQKLCTQNPIVCLMHLPLSVDPNYSAYQRTMITSQEMEAIRLATRFIVSSPYTFEILTSFGVENHKISLVIPGLDNFPQKKDFPDRPSKLLSIANMSSSKDHAILVRALSALKDKDWVLHCYGSLDLDRDYLSELQALIRKNHLQDKILVHGTITGKELSAAYLNADLFVHPSDFETYGMVLAEALAHGLPVVASTGGGICKTVPPKMGQFFKPGDSYGLESILEELMENTEVYRRLCVQAASYKGTAQSWERSIDLFEAALS